MYCLEVTSKEQTIWNHVKGIKLLDLHAVFETHEKWQLLNLFITSLNPIIEIPQVFSKCVTHRIIRKYTDRKNLKEIKLEHNAADETELMKFTVRTVITVTWLQMCKL